MLLAKPPHSKDFANAFAYLFGNNDTIGEAFNIAGDNVITYNNMMSIFAKTLVDKEPELFYIPYEDCLNLSQFMPKDLMIQRMNDEVFDTSKIKSIAANWQTQIDPQRIVSLGLKWLNEDRRRIRINKDLDKRLEELTLRYS